jgi:predicted nucleic acid-binding protein
MTVLVIDASVALAWIYQRENHQEAACADRALEALKHTSATVPFLFHTEVANALLVGERRKVVTEAQVIDFLTKLKQLPIHVDHTTPLDRQDQVMALAREHTLTVYDATYFELALRTDATLATFDRALVSAMKSAGGKLFV